MKWQMMNVMGEIGH